MTTTVCEPPAVEYTVAPPPAAPQTYTEELESMLSAAENTIRDLARAKERVEARLALSEETVRSWERVSLTLCADLRYFRERLEAVPPTFTINITVMQGGIVNVHGGAA